ncbi:MAG: TadE family protein, partial [Planctomycetota bacterium]
GPSLFTDVLQQLTPFPSPRNLPCAIAASLPVEVMSAKSDLVSGRAPRPPRSGNAPRRRRLSIRTHGTRPNVQKSDVRDAAAATEAAFLLPLLILFTVFTIDVCSALFIKEQLTFAAYEGARAGIQRDSTDADVRAAVVDFLTQRDITFDANDAVVISPSFDTAETLEPVNVTVRVRAGENLISPADLFGDRWLRATVQLRKEFQNRNQVTP